MEQVVAAGIFSAFTCLADGCTVVAVLTALARGGAPLLWGVSLGLFHGIFLLFSFVASDRLHHVSHPLAHLVAAGVAIYVGVHLLRELTAPTACAHSCGCHSTPATPSESDRKRAAWWVPLLFAPMLSLDSLAHGMVIKEFIDVTPPALLLMLALISMVSVTVCVTLGIRLKDSLANVKWRGISFLKPVLTVVCFGVAAVLLYEAGAGIHLH